MAISEKLTYLNETKKQIKNALQSKGVSVSDSDTFRSYAQKISNIQVGGVSKLPQVADKTIQELNASDLNGATTIKANVFTNCTNLTSVELPDSVTSVETDAFAGCTNLESFDTGNGITDISNLTFSTFNNIKNVVVGNRVTNVGNAFKDSASLESVKLPNNITSIENGMFKNCVMLTDINIPNTVTRIGDNAFEGCSSFTSITIPEQLTYLGSFAYSNISNLTEINYNMPTNSKTYSPSPFHLSGSNAETLVVNIGENVTQIPGGLFRGATNRNQYFTTIKFANSSKISNFSYDTFSFCGNVEKVYITESLENWCNRYFYDNTAVPYGSSTNGADLYINNVLVKDLRIPSSVKSIGQWVFTKCNFDSVTIEAGVESIEYRAFEQCNIATSMTLMGETEIKDYAIQYCKNLKTLKCLSSNPPVIPAYGLPSSITRIEVPSASLGTYKTATNWVSYADKMVGV